MIDSSPIDVTRAHSYQLTGAQLTGLPTALHVASKVGLQVRSRHGLELLRAGINWQFQSFAEYMTMLRGRGAYMNLGVLVGHSAYAPP